MNIRDFYLYLHHAIHFTGKAAWKLKEPMIAHYRTVLPGHNSIARLLWHIARGEDWAVQTILQGDEQLLTRDGWADRMGIAEPGIGAGMTQDEMVTLTEQIDLDGVRGYYAATAAATQEFFRSFEFAALNAPFDLQGRLALAPEAPSPKPIHRQAYARWTTPLVWVEVFTLVDVTLHIADADHVLNLLVSDRQVD